MSAPGASLRLFVALELPDEVRNRLAQTQSEWRAALGSLNASWTRPEDFHLTLRFLGAVPEASVPALIQSLQRVASHCESPSLIAEGLGCFPTPRRPRVAWAGITDEHGSVSALHEMIAAATNSFAAGPEDQRFHAHVTLARFK